MIGTAVRASVRRDVPGRWSWTLRDEHSDLIHGVAPSWTEAIREATLELEQLDDLHQLQAVAADVTVTAHGHGPGFDGYCDVCGVPEDARPADARPVWRRWLGL